MGGMQNLPAPQPMFNGQSGGGKPGGHQLQPRPSGGIGTKPGGTLPGGAGALLGGLSPGGLSSFAQQDPNPANRGPNMWPNPGQHDPAQTRTSGINPVPSWYQGTLPFRGVDHPNPLIGRGPQIQGRRNTMRNTYRPPEQQATPPSAPQQPQTS